MKKQKTITLSEEDRAKIRAARIAKGYSMQALSKKLFRHRGAVEAIENGRNNPSPELLKDIYAELDLE